MNRGTGARVSIMPASVPHRTARMSLSVASERWRLITPMRAERAVMGIMALA